MTNQSMPDPHFGICICQAIKLKRYLIIIYDDDEIPDVMRKPITKTVWDGLFRLTLNMNLINNE